MSDLNLPGKLKRISNLISADSKKAFADSVDNFDYSLFSIIKLLHQYKELSVKQISDLMDVTHPATVQMINKLVEKKIIETYDKPSDRRVTIIKITKRGMELYERLKEITDKLEAAYQQIISEVDPKFMLTLDTLEERIKSKSVSKRVIEYVKDEQLKKIRIIPFTSERREIFKQLNSEWLDKYFEVEEEDIKALEQPENYYIKNGGEIFFAIVDDSIVGTCAIKKIGKRIFELSKMAVTEKHQGKQVGKKLALTAIGFAYEKRAEKILLETSPKLKTAINLYKKLGFVIVLEDFPTNYKRELFRMELNLK